MDIASLIGFIGAIGMILGAMISGGGIGPFVDVPSLLIVIGGTFFSVMYTCPLPVFLGSFGAMAKAFLPPVKKMEQLVERMAELAAIARKDGMMALEGQDVPDKFFQKGLQMLVDGADADFTFIFASPEKTDELCAPLETNGIYSCRNEEQVVINYFRWENGAADFGTDLKTYRLYLINHETGHILGWGHTGCPKEGAIAPVMMQQSKTTDGCQPYGWPLYEIIDMKYSLDTFVSIEDD